MTLSFRALLESAGIDPAEVILLRHSPSQLSDPISAWRADRSAFESYQSFQAKGRKTTFSRPLWASFVAGRDGRTLFVGLYQSRFLRPAAPGVRDHFVGGFVDHETADSYECVLRPELSDYAGRLYIEWGAGSRTWIQLGANEKPVSELLRTFEEPKFPGYLEIVEPLSAVPTLPSRWAEFLRQGKGIYLLTCPRTKEQYVGKADGADGFWGRWITYATTGDGGNVRLKSRERSDYQVSILEVAGSAATADEILRMEMRWKAKLQTREMGLNGN